MSKQSEALKERARKLSVRLDLMEGKTKGNMEDLIGEVVTINDFGFMQDRKDGTEYIAFVVKEDPEKFFFGGMVLTNNLKELAMDGFTDTIIKEGLPVRFGTKKKADKTSYTTVEFYPEAF